MITLCPSNCTDHPEFEFPHSVVVRSWVSKEVVSEKRYRMTVTFVMCRGCHHWIARQKVRCFCRFECHEKSGGYIVVKTPLDQVESF